MIEIHFDKKKKDKPLSFGWSTWTPTFGNVVKDFLLKENRILMLGTV